MSHYGCPPYGVLQQSRCTTKVSSAAGLLSGALNVIQAYDAADNPISPEFYANGVSYVPLDQGARILGQVRIGKTSGLEVKATFAMSATDAADAGFDTASNNLSLGEDLTSALIAGAAAVLPTDDVTLQSEGSLLVGSAVVGDLFVFEFTRNDSHPGIFHLVGLEVDTP